MCMDEYHTSLSCTGAHGYYLGFECLETGAMWIPLGPMIQEKLTVYIFELKGKYCST